MKLKLGVGTGTFYSKENYDINGTIRNINLLDVSFIEITFGFLESFEELVLSEESLQLLKNFDLVTIHAPCVNYVKGKNAEPILVKLKELYNLIGAKHITFHPHYFEDFSILLDYDWNVCIENSRPGKGWDFEKLRGLFTKYPQFGFVLDICHAVEFSKDELSTLFNEFKDRIKYFHLSATYNGNNHQPLHSLDDENYLLIFEEIINFDKPKLIETCGGLEVVKKEINFLRKRFEA
jgi:hypothetical protein